MRTFLPYLFFVLSITAFGQDFNETLNTIREAEAKAALNQMFYRANLNTGNYDLKYHRLELNVDPSVSFISGDVTTYFEAKEALTEITFDLADNMTVSQVLHNGNTLSYTQNSDDELIITLPAVQNAGVLDSLTISYSGNPISSGFGSFEQTTHNGDPIIWTLSEPYGAKGWWPCKQDLIDKIDSVDVYLTTPQFNPSNEAYVAVSNGLEISQTTNGSDKTTRYKHRHPIPAYLIAIAVTNYEVYSHTVSNNGNPFDIVNYVFPENLASAQASTPVTVDIMNIFSDLFEEYPFADEKYGHAQFGWGGGMEHTTVSFMGNFSRNLIAHELAHQWFGNKITCGSWKDIWLNEGFATYLSGIVYEELDGNEAFINWKQQNINTITSAPDGAVYLSDADTLSVSRIFNYRLSYSKGAMVLHMLRKKLGDTEFFGGLQTYLVDEDHAYDYAKTEEFINIIETTSGQDLTEFFSDWLYSEGYPSYTINCTQQSPTEIDIEISQTQSHASVSFFEAPVPIRLIGTEGETLDLVLDNTTNNQVFNESINFIVDTVIFDPEADLISKNNTVSLSINEEAFNNKLLIYPSPVSETLNIKKPDFLQVEEVRVYNALGQLLYNSEWTSTIDTTPFSTGLLFVQLQTNEGIINKSVLKN
ncbi:M1 family aminopeptidase [Meridianimaribacter flavus]|uniref:Aminopeptidase N n=1 Tax=Meridianimaribacter flavus TaxID=571115 RepID=A0ABY2G8V9_9FLAO|nr:M1 family aminopeptidase [Meridianimaribacter flavus]TDY13693.1 putative secreted protein (Por secretion system target) [Meridianimaribacter flavus]